MGVKEKLRAGRKAFLRRDWGSAKGFFIEVQEGAASTEGEKRVARSYLREIYLLEGRAQMARRRGGRRIKKNDKAPADKEPLRDSLQTPVGRPPNRSSLGWKKALFLGL